MNIKAELLKIPIVNLLENFLVYSAAFLVTSLLMIPIPVFLYY